jgi:hypothetical protein
MKRESGQDTYAPEPHEWVYALIWLLPAVAGLLALNILGRGAPTWVLVLAWLVISLVMLGGLWIRALSRRHAFLGAYLHQASPWRRRLRGGPVLALHLWLQAAVLALVLVVAIARLQQDLQWWLLTASLPVLIGLQALVRRLLRAHVSPAYLPELSWRVTMALQFATLFGAMAWLALYGQYPEFAEVTLKQALWHEMSRERAVSGPLEALLQLAAAKDALALWLGQQLLPALGSPLLRLGGWTLLLAAEGLFVWSYLVFAAGVAALPGWRR